MDQVEMKVTPDWDQEHPQKEPGRVCFKADIGQHVVGVAPPKAAFVDRPKQRAGNGPEHIVFHLIVEQKEALVRRRPVTVVFLQPSLLLPTAQP